MQRNEPRNVGVWSTRYHYPILSYPIFFLLNLTKVFRTFFLFSSVLTMPSSQTCFDILMLIMFYLLCQYSDCRRNSTGNLNPRLNPDAKGPLANANAKSGSKLRPNKPRHPRCHYFPEISKCIISPTTTTTRQITGIRRTPSIPPPLIPLPLYLNRTKWWRGSTMSRRLYPRSSHLLWRSSNSVRATSRLRMISLHQFGTNWRRNWRSLRSMTTTSPISCASC